VYRKLVPLFVLGQDSARIDEALAIAHEENVIITIRSRAMEALKWLRDGAALKPEQMKIKTLDAIDCIWLGFDCRYKSTVVVHELEPWQTVERRLARNGIGLGSEEYWDVAQRYDDRKAEWAKAATGENGDPLDLVKWNTEGEVTLRWNWQDNEIPRQNQERTGGFRLVDTTTGKPLPPGEQPKPGRSYAAQVCQNGKFRNVSPCPQTQKNGWRAIAGDTDMVSITNPDGSNLTQAQNERILTRLRQSGLGIMHPYLATWTKKLEATPFMFKSKLDQLESGAFLQLCPGKTIRVVQFAKDTRLSGESYPAMKHQARPQLREASLARLRRS
jgi:hypothetical protein